MADETTMTEAGQLGERLQNAATGKLIDAATIYLKGSTPVDACDLYFGAISRLISVDAAHLGIDNTVDMLDCCIKSLRRMQRRGRH